MRHVQSFGNASEQLLDLGWEQEAEPGGGAEQSPATDSPGSSFRFLLWTEHTQVWILPPSVPAA